MGKQQDEHPVNPWVKPLRQGVFGFFKRAKQRVLAAWRPSRFQLVERIIQCDHCGQELFRDCMVQVHVTGRQSAFGWSSRRACVLICDHCGRMHWYFKRPEKLTDRPNPEGERAGSENSLADGSDSSDPTPPSS